MNCKASIIGKTQNRTALGIVHAYVALNPKATLAELRRAFPNNLCPDSGVDELLLPQSGALKYNTKADMSLYFTKEGETITLADGSVVCLSQIWSKTSLDKFVANAANLGIQASDPDKTLDYDKPGFKITIHQQPKKGCLGMLIALIAIPAAALLCIFNF
ncbi:MAG: hypothetical protein ACI30X_05220 [Muribaculaceae bacterium]